MGKDSGAGPSRPPYHAPRPLSSFPESDLAIVTYPRPVIDKAGPCPLYNEGERSPAEAGGAREQYDGTLLYSAACPAGACPPMRTLLDDDDRVDPGAMPPPGPVPRPTARRPRTSEERAEWPWKRPVRLCLSVPGPAAAGGLLRHLGDWLWDEPALCRDPLWPAAGARRTAPPRPGAAPPAGTWTTLLPSGRAGLRPPLWRAIVRPAAPGANAPVLARGHAPLVAPPPPSTLTALRSSSTGTTAAGLYRPLPGLPVREQRPADPRGRPGLPPAGGPAGLRAAARPGGGQHPGRCWPGTMLNNVLLFGDGGTGKSATVKSMLLPPRHRRTCASSRSRRRGWHRPAPADPLPGGTSGRSSSSSSTTWPFDQDDKTYSIHEDHPGGRAGAAARPTWPSTPPPIRPATWSGRTFSDRGRGRGGRL